MSFGSFSLASGATLLAFLPFAVVQAVAYPSYAEVFPAPVRYTGVSLGFNFGSIFGGAITPFVCAWLVDATEVLLARAYFVMVASLVGVRSRRILFNRLARHDLRQWMTRRAGESKHCLAEEGRQEVTVWALGSRRFELKSQHSFASWAT